MRRERWRPVAYFLAGVAAAALTLPAMALGSGVSFSLLETIYATIEARYVQPVPPATLIDGAITGMVGALGDPYTEYFPPQAYRRFLDSLNGELGGIGVTVREVGSTPVVRSVLAGTPAAAAGLMAGDRILAVDGRALAGLGAREASDLIRGDPGTRVTLTVRREHRTFRVTMTRARIVEPAVSARMLPGGIAYVAIHQFSQDSGGRVLRAVGALAARRPRGWVVNLRNDPGGLVSQAVAAAEAFIGHGVVVRFQSRGGGQTIVAQGTRRGPVAVLVNGGTASAAEILAGALEDDDGAVLVGRTTFGKGVAQDLIHLPEGGVLKLTVDRWYTPSGENVTGRGLAPGYFSSGKTASLLAAERLLGGTGQERVRLRAGRAHARVNGRFTPLGTAPRRMRGVLMATPGTLELALGVVAVEDPLASAVVVRWGRLTLDLPWSSPTAMLNGKPVTLTTPPERIGTTTWIPVAEVARVLGFGVTAQRGGVDLEVARPAVH